MNSLLTTKEPFILGKEKTRHSKETAKALRKQLIIWAYNNSKFQPIKFSHLQNKCQSISINRMFSSIIIKTKIMIQKDRGFIWNPDIKNPDFDALTNFAQNSERALKRESAKKNNKIKLQKLPITTNDSKLDVIIEKLNAISKAIGIQ